MIVVNATLPFREKGRTRISSEDVCVTQVMATSASTKAPTSCYHSSREQGVASGKMIFRNDGEHVNRSDVKRV